MMTQHQWDTIQKSLVRFSVQDKLELIERLRQSIQEETCTPDRTRQQNQALRELCLRLDVMPAAEHSDGLTNRDHDLILYTR
jgi:hypothetical protein